jgi:lipoprotein NlpD
MDPNAAASRGITTARVESRPLDAKPVATTAASAGAAASSPPSAAASSAAAAQAAAPAPTPAPAREGDDDINWAWPAAGPVIAPFDEGKSKGLAIGGKAGDPVYASADGRVVYAGSGLRGYGNLIILKHNNTYLTAYAHNQTLLVKEDQNVRRGQKIAEMGSTDADGTKLHFEIRKQGKPVDPARLLPPR